MSVNNEGDTIENKVTSNTTLVTLDLETYYPETDLIGFDIKPFLFKEMILKEKDFREALKNLDWTPYEKKAVYIYCSTEAIIPMWAYMLVAKYLSPISEKFIFGDKNHIVENLMLQKIQNIDFQEFKDKKVLVKGC